MFGGVESFSIDCTVGSHPLCVGSNDHYFSSGCADRWNVEPIVIAR